MKIGNYEIIPLDTGTFALDGGAMFGIIPKPLWEKTNPADEKNRILLGARTLLLKSDEKIILIDTGMGSDWEEKFAKIYKLNSSPTLTDSLLANGIKTDEVTDVILTHLHFDHTGGSTKKEGEKWLPAFPNAKYHIQKEQFDWALNPTERDRGSYIKNRFVPLADEGLVNFVDGDALFDETIEFITVNGHTKSQQLVKISDGNKTLLHCGDLIPTSSHVPLPYIMAYDLRPLQTLEEKKKLFPRAVEEGWFFYYGHDPYFVASKIERTEKGFKATNKVKFLDELS